MPSDLRIVASRDDSPAYGLIPLIVLLLVAVSARAQDDSGAGQRGFPGASESIQQELREAQAELSQLEARLALEKIPLAQELAALEQELAAVREEFQTKDRTLGRSVLSISNLRKELEARDAEIAFLGSLLGEYIGKFEPQLHITELQRYRGLLDATRLAAANTGLSAEQVLTAQSELLVTSIDRLEDMLGGSRFPGRAVDSEGRISEGTFLVVGPAALFSASNGKTVGTAETRIGSLEPTAIELSEPGDIAAATQIVETGSGQFVLDPTLGNAQKIAATHETFVEHVKKGGTVMYPIFAMAGVALLIALWKWLSLTFIRRPSRRAIDGLLAAVARKDEEAARTNARAMKGPVGAMLGAGVDHIQESAELIEEVMYESVLAWRLKLNRMLPFIAICAASAPLLGLLGTVTGIIHTFKQITLFGSGDVKMLSGGISEALITTEFGLIVAIPSLLIHAFLSRKARGLIGYMESAAIALVNQINKTPFRRTAAVAGATPADIDPDLLRARVRDVLGDLLGPVGENGFEGGGDRESALQAS